MMHPDTCLRHIDDRIGHGVYATQPIPAGTITFTKDKLDIVIRDDDPILESPAYRAIIDTYAYREANGDNILGWDISRFVNHSCEPNTLSTGYGFEIAVRDIASGEQITDDYGLFNIGEEMRCLCGSRDCRDRIRSDDLEYYWRSWDTVLAPQMKKVLAVDQPLLGFIDDRTWSDVLHDLNTGNNCRSVRSLRFIERLAETCM